MPKYSSKYRSSRRRVAKRRTNKKKTGTTGAKFQFKQRIPRLYAPGVMRQRLGGMALVNNGFPLPGSYNTTHRYVLNLIRANKASGLNGTDFYLSLNNLYEPSVGSGAHQPYGYDQFRSFYINYRVWKVDLQVKIIYSTNRSNGLALYFKPNVNTLVLDNLTLDIAQEISNGVVIQPGTGEMEYQTFETSILLADVFGVKPSVIMNDHSYQGVGNAGPPQTASVGMSVGDWNLNVDQTIRFVVTATYHTIWSGLANPGPS
jgi:hypothetical protein